MPLSSIPLFVCVSVCVYHIIFNDPSIDRHKLFPHLDYCKQYCNEWILGFVYLFQISVIIFFGEIPRSGISGSYGSCPLEKEMVSHSSILAWKIQSTEEPGGLQSMGSQRVGHSWATEPMAAVFLVFWGISVQFSIVAASVYIPTHNVWGFPFSTYSSTLVISYLFDTCHSNRGEVISQCDFDSHFPDN